VTKALRIALALCLLSLPAAAQSVFPCMVNFYGGCGGTGSAPPANKCSQNLVFDHNTATGTPAAYACDVVTIPTLGL